MNQGDITIESGYHLVIHRKTDPCGSIFHGGVYWTKFETISGKIRRILTNDLCASAALDKLARGKTQKFPIIFICGSPHTPRREAEHLKGRKFLVLLPPLHIYLFVVFCYHSNKLTNPENHYFNYSNILQCLQAKNQQ